MKKLGKLLVYVAQGWFDHSTYNVRDFLALYKRPLVRPGGLDDHNFKGIYLVGKDEIAVPASASPSSPAG